MMTMLPNMPAIKMVRYQFLIFNLLLVFNISVGYGAGPSGYSQFYIPGDEQTMNLILDTIGKGDQSGPMHAVISVTAWAGNTTVYYDHWEDGYDFDPNDPGTADETITLASRGDSHTFESAAIALPEFPVSYCGNGSCPYDGRDRLFAAGGAITVTRASWGERKGTMLALAWEVFPVGPQFTTYILPFGEDLADPKGLNLQDFERVFVLIQATENNTAVTVDLDRDGTPDKLDQNRNGTPDGAEVNLNSGDVFLLDRVSAGSPTLNTGAVITGNKTLQVHYIIGDQNTDYEIRGLSAFPRGLWSDAYYAPVAGAAATDDPTDIYLHNPHNSALKIAYETRFSSGSFTIPAGQTRSFTEQTGKPVPQGSAVYLEGDDVFWGVSTIDSSGNSAKRHIGEIHDWAYSLIPEFLLGTEHYLGWAPGFFDFKNDGKTSADYDSSGVFIAPAESNTRVFVDLDNDETPDQIYDLSRLQSQFVYDTKDGDLSNAKIWATGPIALAYGQNPDTAPPSNPAIDVGYSLIQGGQFINLVLTVDKTAEPAVVSTTPGAQSMFTVVVDSHQFAVDGIRIVDTLPDGWQYLDDSTHITFADNRRITGNAADPGVTGPVMTWDSSLLGNMAPEQKLIITYMAETSRGFDARDLSRNVVEASGSRSAGDTTHTFVTSDDSFVGFIPPVVDRTAGAQLGPCGDRQVLEDAMYAPTVDPRIERAGANVNDAYAVSNAGNDQPTRPLVDMAREAADLLSQAADDAEENADVELAGYILDVAYKGSELILGLIDDNRIHDDSEEQAIEVLDLFSLVSNRMNALILKSDAVYTTVADASVGTKLGNLDQNHDGDSPVYCIQAIDNVFYYDIANPAFEIEDTHLIVANKGVFNCENATCHRILVRVETAESEVSYRFYYVFVEECLPVNIGLPLETPADQEPPLTDERPASAS